jgi:copper chaperone CopZ
LRALLNEPYRSAVPVGEVGDAGLQANGCRPAGSNTGWRFCDSPDCNVVYFAEAQDGVFEKHHLRVPVGIKERSGDRPLCYCFGHSVATIRHELLTKGRSDALQDIRRKMKDPGCCCEVTNPSGSCCLGSVAKGIETARQELLAAGSLRSDSGDKGLGEKFAMFGALASAIVASSCCWLPLVLLAAGLSGVQMASTMETYRPVFAVVSVGFLAAAFYFTYRPGRNESDDRHGCCGTQTACHAEAGGWRGVLARTWRCCGRAMNKIMLWVVTVLAAAFLLFPQYVGLLFGNASRGGAPMADDVNQLVVKIDGMVCEGCAATVAQALRAVPGVVAVEVDYAHRQAVVSTSACCPVQPGAILSALRRAGYTGLVARRPAGP